MPETSSSRIAVTGRSIPPRMIENDEIESRCGLEPGWILKRTGIKSRPVVEPDQSVSDLAIEAGQNALAQFESTASSATNSVPGIGMLILATSTPDYLLPPTAPFVADQLSLGPIPAFDMAVACSGFVYALQLADSHCRNYQQSVLVIAANVLSKRVSYQDPSTAAIFADGAGAVIVSPTDQKGILSIALASDGSGYDALIIPDGGSKTPFNETTLANENHKMKISNGKSVYRYAVESMSSLAEQVLSDSGISASEVDFWIPHQANLRIIESVRQRLGIDTQKVGITIDRFANSSAATIPIAIDYFLETGQLRRGDLLLVTTAAAGLTSGAALIQL